MVSVVLIERDVARSIPATIRDDRPRRTVRLVVDYDGSVREVNSIAGRRCLLAAALFGAAAPAASVVARSIPPVLLAGLLYLGAAIAVTPACVHRPPRRAAVASEWPLLAIAVLAGGTLGPILFVTGLERSSAATASLMLNLELVATLAIAAAVFHEHLGSRLLSGSGLVCLAALALTWQPGARPDWGAALVAAACLCWGIDNSVTARVHQVAPEHITFLKGAIAGTTNIAIGVRLGVDGAQFGGIATSIMIGMVGYGASITLWVKGARDLGAARAQAIFATAPFIGVLASWLLLGERVAPAQMFAFVLVACGVVLALGGGHEHLHVHEGMAHEHEHHHDDDHHREHHHDSAPATGRHSHRHEHRPLVHAHPHLPDLHHRHDH